MCCAVDEYYRHVYTLSLVETGAYTADDGRLEPPKGATRQRTQ